VRAWNNSVSVVYATIITKWRKPKIGVFISLPLKFRLPIFTYPFKFSSPESKKRSSFEHCIYGHSIEFVFVQTTGDRYVLRIKFEDSFTFYSKYIKPIKSNNTFLSCSVCTILKRLSKYIYFFYTKFYRIVLYNIAIVSLTVISSITKYVYLNSTYFPRYILHC